MRKIYTLLVPLRKYFCLQRTNKQIMQIYVLRNISESAMQKSANQRCRIAQRTVQCCRLQTGATNATSQLRQCLYTSWFKYDRD